MFGSTQKWKKKDSNSTSIDIQTIHNRHEHKQKLLEICKERDTQQAQQFVKANTETMNNAIMSQIDQQGNTLLHLAVAQQDYLLVQLLLRKGADPSVMNKSGINPLMLAQRTGQDEIMRALQKYKVAQLLKETPLKEAKLDEQVEGEKIKISLCVAEPERKALKTTLEAKQFSMVNAAFLGSLDAIQPAINPENMNEVDENGCTMLMKACYRGHVDLVKFLIEQRVDVNKVCNRGNTALVWAIYGGRTSLVKPLVEGGADLQGARVLQGTETIIKMTPLVAASFRGFNEVVEYLLGQGAHPDTRIGPGKGKSAIMVASWMGHKAVVRTLLQNRAYVDHQVETWVSWGYLHVKKSVIEENPWVYLQNEQSNYLKSGVGHSSLTQMNRGQQRRVSIQDKIAYCTSNEIEVVNEMTNMLIKRAGMHGTPTDGINVQEAPSRIGSTPVGTRANLANRKRNTMFRQGLNLEKIIGNNSQMVLTLAEQMPVKGTELDALWIQVFQCVVQLVMAANKNIKHYYIAISAKVIHCSAEIVRAIEFAEKTVGNIDAFSATPVKAKIKALANVITTQFPKKLMLATRMAIGVWPPPDAVEEMIREAASLAAACMALVHLANGLGLLPALDKTLEVNFQPFEESEQIEEESQEEKSKAADKDKRLQGGLNYSEYKRQNNLKLIEQLSKGYGDLNSSSSQTDVIAQQEKQQDMEFLERLDALLKQFVSSVTELKSMHDKHFVEEFIKATSMVHVRADTLIEECQSFELLKDIPDELMFDEKDSKKLGITLETEQASVKLVFRQAIEQVRNATKQVMIKGKTAADPRSPPSASQEMLQATLPCVLGVKRLVLVAKEASSRVRQTYSEERRKRDLWRKEALQNERVKHLFQMWESQVMGDSSPAQKQQTTLKDDELKILEDQFDQLVFEDQNGKKVVRGGTLHQMVMYITHHQIKDDDFTLALLMTHHSFTTSAELMDLLLKRYEITPPYGLNQRLFEVYLEKKVVPIRLRVCHCLMMWIQNHFEEDFMDNEPLFIRVREFVERKVMYDFENMAPGMLATLEVKLREESKPKYVLKPQYDKQIKNANATKFGMVVEQVFNLNLLQTDPRAFLDIDALEIAKQLTCVEFELFAQVQVYECLDQIWGSRRKKEAMAYREVKKSEIQKSGVQITRLINHTNQIGLWVASTILATENPKQRLNVIKYFIHLANHCKELNNLTGLTTVLAGLFMGPVERLKKTWQALAEKHPKSMETFKELGPLVSAKFQYAQYRKYVKDMSPPAIPFLGVYLTDLTFIEDGNSDFLPDSHLINFDKRNKVYSLITDKVVRFQQVPYDLTPIGQIIDFIKKLSSPSGAVGWEESSPIMTYEELEQLSLQVEPLELESDEDEDDAE